MLLTTSKYCTLSSNVKNSFGSMNDKSTYDGDINQDMKFEPVKVKILSDDTYEKPWEQGESSIVYANNINPTGQTIGDVYNNTMSNQNNYVYKTNEGSKSIQPPQGNIVESTKYKINKFLSDNSWVKPLLIGGSAVTILLLGYKAVPKIMSQTCPKIRQDIITVDDFKNYVGKISKTTNKSLNWQALKNVNIDFSDAKNQNRQEEAFTYLQQLSNKLKQHSYVMADVKVYVSSPCGIVKEMALKTDIDSAMSYKQELKNGNYNYIENFSISYINKYDNRSMRFETIARSPDIQTNYSINFMEKVKNVITNFFS